MFPKEFNLADLNGKNGFALNAIKPQSYTGFLVSGAGDINGDGIDDIIIGAPNYDEAGHSYVVFGSKSGFNSSLDLASLNGTNGFALNGFYQVPQFRSGHSVSGAGDVNGDGIADVIIGSYETTNNAVIQSYVIYGNNGSYPSPSPSPSATPEPNPSSEPIPSPGSSPSSDPHISPSPGANNNPTGGSNDVGLIVGGAVVIGAIAALAWYGKTHGWCAG